MKRLALNDGSARKLSDRADEFNPPTGNLLTSNSMGSGRTVVRGSSARASERFKEFEFYGSWIFLGVQQQLFSIQLVEVQFVGDYFSSPFSLQIKPV